MRNSHHSDHQITAATRKRAGDALFIAALTAGGQLAIPSSAAQPIGWLLIGISVLGFVFVRGFRFEVKGSRLIATIDIPRFPVRGHFFLIVILVNVATAFSLSFYQIVATRAASAQVAARINGFVSAFTKAEPEPPIPSFSDPDWQQNFTTALERWQRDLKNNYNPIAGEAKSVAERLQENGFETPQGFVELVAVAVNLLQLDDAATDFETLSKAWPNRRAWFSNWKLCLSAIAICILCFYLVEIAF